MANELETYDPSEALLPDLVNQFDDQYDQVASAGGFLPRMQLFIANSALVKESKIPMNHYGLVAAKDNVDDLGKEVDVLLIAWRPRALDTSDKNNIRASSIIASELFQEIKEKSGETNSGCLFGPEFLIWIPSRDKFAGILFGSKSARMEARNVQQFIQKPCTFKSRLIKTSAYSWQAMVVSGCSSPMEIPIKEKLLEVADDFLNNAKEITGAEKVEAAVKSATDRVR